MTTSGTTNFDPANSDIIIEAFDRIEIRPDQITSHHLNSARTSLNLGLITFSNRGVNLWAVDLQEVPLLANQPDYDILPDTASVLDTFIRYTVGGESIDRTINPLSRTDYANLSNKFQPGVPTAYWYERTVQPKMHMWLVPQDATFTLFFYRLRRLQDADALLSQTADVIWRLQDALIADLAARLAMKFNAAKYPLLKQEAKDSWMEASTEDTENVPIFIKPDLSGYFS